MAVVSYNCRSNKEQEKNERRNLKKIRLKDLKELIKKLLRLCLGDSSKFKNVILFPVPLCENSEVCGLNVSLEYSTYTPEGREVKRRVMLSTKFNICGVLNRNSSPGEEVVFVAESDLTAQIPTYLESIQEDLSRYGLVYREEFDYNDLLKLISSFLGSLNNRQTDYLNRADTTLDSLSVKQLFNSEQCENAVTKLKENLNNVKKTPKLYNGDSRLDSMSDWTNPDCVSKFQVQKMKQKQGPYPVPYDRNVEERKANSGNKKEHSDKSTKYNRRKEKVSVSSLPYSNDARSGKQQLDAEKSVDKNTGKHEDKANFDVAQKVGHFVEIGGREVKVQDLGRFLCVACTQFAEIPVLTPCGHIYCKDCGVERIKVCVAPTCGKVITKFFESKSTSNQQKCYSYICPKTGIKVHIGKFKNHIKSCHCYSSSLSEKPASKTNV